MGGGGDGNSFHCYSHEEEEEEEESVDSLFIDHTTREFFDANEGFIDKTWLSSDSSETELVHLRRRKDYEEIMQGYDSFKARVQNLDEAKRKLLSYKPGDWTEEVGGMKINNYDVPKTTSLILLGPRGSGKSSLVNRISRVFEDDSVTSERAQVSYNSSVGHGTLFLNEYMIPSGSTSFCLYDTRSLSENSCDNSEMIKSWMTKGVRHGELVLRDSDSSCVRKLMKCKAQKTCCSKDKRMVNFVILVVNAHSVLKSMSGEDDMQYTRLLEETFSCLYLSCKDDKPVVVCTHGDILSHTDRACVRIHLGELLGIPPAKQIFDIPDKCDPETNLAVVDMLTYSLMHADKNLPGKTRSPHKVLGMLMMIMLVCVCLFAFWSTFHSFKLGHWHATWHLWRNSTACSESPETYHAIPKTESGEAIHIAWHEIRHIWEA
ncbi:hypothetical protein IFM89_022210 [Coptis chinensis]|uniref:Uncharacterized protein n=1 Tax=Coptis chinensis TaxID=261450 RepID=A0A835HWM9_9MAGN|nr:hypothetical protein IFM89_022210 [Coptis chinensis]